MKLQTRFAETERIKSFKNLPNKRKGLASGLSEAFAGALCLIAMLIFYLMNIDIMQNSIFFPLIIAWRASGHIIFFSWVAWAKK